MNDLTFFFVFSLLLHLVLQPHRFLLMEFSYIILPGLLILAITLPAKHYYELSFGCRS